ncbi:MAG: TetR family transcriptional regulator [Alphaproteobacteria bacterium]|nr:TetR family transcriptional regulator [Alphaproteobacteria bacterium]
MTEPMIEPANNKKKAKAKVVKRAAGNAEQTKKNILSAAMHEFAEYGDSGARIDRIAARANANKSLIFRYFSNKEALYASALKEAYRQIRMGEEELELEQLEPYEAIRKLMRFTMEHYLKSPWFLRLLATENLRRGQTIENMEGIAGLQSPLITQLTKVLKRGEEMGLFRENVNPSNLYIIIASLFYFPISNVYTLPVVFGVDVGSSEWLEQHLRSSERMILAHLKK